MPENLKIQLGVKTLKGYRRSTNEDRLLIGMDPASNDWLFSPDETSPGEFGVLLMLADGLGEEEGGAEAAHIATQTIQQLFDQTLELPSDESSLQKLLLKYLQIANQQIFRRFGGKRGFCSIAVCLIRNEWAHLFWVGNCRIYRYQSLGVRGSLFTESPVFEQLSIDHTAHSQRVLSGMSVKPDKEKRTSLLQAMGQQEDTIHFSSRMLKVNEGDRILLCSEGLHLACDEKELVNLLGTDQMTQHIAEYLAKKALDNEASENISVVLMDITSGPPATEKMRATPSVLLDDSKVWFGLPTALARKSILQRLKKRKSSLIDKASEDAGFAAQSGMQIAFRTVLPFDEDTLEKVEDENEVFQQIKESYKQEEAVSQPSAEMSVHEENERSGSALLPSDTNLKSATETEEKASEPILPREPQKLRIKMTVYPDPEDYERPSDTQNAFNAATESLLPVAQDELQQSIIEPSTEANFEDFDVQIDKLTDNKEPSVDQELEEFDHEAPEEEPEQTELHILSEEESDANEPIEEEEISVLSEDIQEFGMEPMLDELGEEEDEEEEVEDDDEDHAATIESLISENTLPEDEPEVDSSHSKSLEAILLKEEEDSEKTTLPLFNETETLTSEGESDQRNDGYPLLRRMVIVLFGGVIILALAYWLYNLPESEPDIPPQATVEIPKPKVEKQESVPKVQKETEVKNTIKDSEPEMKRAAEASKEKEKAVSKEQKKKGEALPKTEPEYDAQIQQNKHQLIDEVSSLWTRKNELCKKVGTYRNNAPQKKQERLDALLYDCDQLEQKFSSIFDVRSGYFKTVRYDFLVGTINNIKVSITRVESRLEEIRQE